MKKGLRVAGVALIILGLVLVLNPSIVKLQVLGGTPYFTGVREPLVYRGYQMTGYSYSDNDVIVRIYVAFANPDPERYLLTSVDGKAYYDSNLIAQQKRGVSLDLQGGGETNVDFNLGVFDEPRTFRFTFALVGIDENDEPPKQYHTWDTIEASFTITPPPRKQTPTECIVSFYTEPMLPSELTIQVKFVFNGVEYGVGQTARVPPGTYTLASVTPPEGYFVTSVYGTGGIYVDENNVVSVQGDGNIVAILSSTANPGEPPGSTPDGGGGWEVIDKNKVIIQALGGLMSSIGIIFLIAAGKQK